LRRGVIVRPPELVPCSEHDVAVVARHYSGPLLVPASAPLQLQGARIRTNGRPGWWRSKEDRLARARLGGEQ
jgi:hypothetical protein